MVGPQDQRSLINTFNIAPSRTDLFNDRMLFSLNTFVRQDRYPYCPRANIFADYLATLGMDNLFCGERCRWNLRATVINRTNKVALYNFLSTFSGTHYITPRTETVELGFHF